MTQPTLTTFNQIAPLIIQKYERYLPTAFDDSMTMLEKVNKVINYMNEMGNDFSDIVKEWNELIEWIDTGGITDDVNAKLDEMANDGTLEQLINVDIIGSLSNLETLDTTSLVSSINENHHKNMGFVSTQQFMDENIGFTESLKQALQVSNVVYIPDGDYQINSTIYIGNNKKVIGNGKDTIIKPTGDFNVFEFDVDSSISDLTINLRDVLNFNSHVFEISNLTLKSSSYTGSSNVRISIHDIDVISDSSNGDSSVFALFMENAIDNVKGFYGVSISNINHIGFNDGINYFIKNYCKLDCWITGISVKDCINHGTVWGIFDGKSDIDLLDSSITSNIDKMSIINLQHQCKSITKGFAYIRDGEKNFINCVPWDWHYAVSPYTNRPILVNNNLTNKVGFEGRKEGVNRLNILQDDGTIYATDYNEYFLYDDYIKNDEVIPSPKIIGLSNDTGTSSNVKSFLVYKGSKMNSTNNSLMFKFKTFSSKLWIDVSIYPSATDQLSYQSSIPIPAGYVFKWRIVNGETEIYLCRDAEGSALSQYDLIKTEPMTNNSESYSHFNKFTNYYFTVDNFSGEHLTTIPLDLTDVLNGNTV